MVTVIANMALFPGIAWVFYHSKEMINGAVVGTEVFFGGLICTLIVGITGHWEAAQKEGGCFTCQVRGNCPFLGIFIMGICFGVLCVTASHFYLGNNDVAFKTLIGVKVFQGIFLGIALPLCLVKFKLLLHPEVDHKVQCPLSTLAPEIK